MQVSVTSVDKDTHAPCTSTVQKSKDNQAIADINCTSHKGKSGLFIDYCEMLRATL